MNAYSFVSQPNKQQKQQQQQPSQHKYGVNLLKYKSEQTHKIHFAIGQHTNLTQTREQY